MSTALADEHQTLLEGRRLSKLFAGNRVLTDVSIHCEPGTVLSLVGENGAGKSTLINLLSGVHQPSAGEILYRGERVHFHSPQDAKRRGIYVVHQELSLASNLNVAENIFLGSEKRGSLRLLDNQAMNKEASEIFERFGYAMDADTPVIDLSPAQRQMVEIVKAVSRNPEVLILDEPTSSLSTAEVQLLFQIVREQLRRGASVVFVSHRLDEVFGLSDQVMVLKDGALVAHVPTQDLSRSELIRLMVGRNIEDTFPQKRPVVPDQPVTLRLEEASQRSLFAHVTMEVPRGHIVGIGGLEGHGQRELARSIFGITPITSGKVYLEGTEVHVRSPREAIRLGIAFVPDDRTDEGLVLPLSVRENIVLATLGRIARRGLVQQRLEREAVRNEVARYKIKTESVDTPVRALSGGNQQKVIFSKWLRREPRLLILHEPTRGIDIQSKMEIYQLLRDLADKNVGIIVITSDMLELMGISDVVYVMYEGTVSGRVEGEQITEENIMRLSSGMRIEGAAV